MTLVTYDSGQKFLKRSIGLNLQELAFQTIDKIDRLLFNAKEDIQAWSSMEVMQSLTAGDPEGRITNVLTKLKKKYGIYSGIFCINAKGEIIASSNPGTIGVDVSGKQWFKEAAGKRQVLVKDLRKSGLVGGFALDFTAPIFDSRERRNVIGFLSSRLNWSELFEITNSVKVSTKGQTPSGYTLLINKQGFVISGPGFILEDEGNKERLSDKNLISLGFQSAKLALQGQKGFLIEYNPSGEKILAGYAGSKGYREFGGFGWGVLILHEAREAFSVVTKLKNIFIGMGVIISLFSVLLALFIAGRISIPIRKLTDAANEISMDYPSKPLEITSGDEIGQLGQTFNKMNRYLKRYKEEQAKLITELKNKNTEMKQFTYTISHDLKSPLVTISGFVALLEKDAAAANFDYMKRDVERITAATRKMKQQLDELLEFIRIGRVPHSPEEIALGDLAREAVDRVAGQILKRGAQVVIPSELPLIFGDKSRLLNVMQNLISNAVKYMGDQPQPRIEIGAEKNGRNIVWYVKDNGMGIDPQYHQKVFSLFEKLEPHTEGVGMGLAIVKRIIESHGGRVWIESDGQEKGAIFYISLPSPKTLSREE